MPSIEPMFTTRAGSSSVAAARSWGSSARVRWNTPFTLMANSLSKAASGYSSSGAPQVAPALLTRRWMRSSRSAISAARARQPASVDRSAAMPMQVPRSDSSAATRAQASALREAT